MMRAPLMLLALAAAAPSALAAGGVWGGGRGGRGSEAEEENHAGGFAANTSRTRRTSPISCSPGSCCDDCTIPGACCGSDGGVALCSGGSCYPCCGTSSQAATWNAAHSCDYSTQWLSSPASSTAFGHCSPLTVCNASTQFQSSPKAQNRDRTCQNLTVCSGTGTPYELSAPTATTDRNCTANVYAHCVQGATYLTAPPTATTTGVCSQASNCSFPAQYEAAAPTVSTDRVCSNVTNCTVGINYQSAAPTNTSDRVCGSSVTNCTLNATWSSVQPTTTTDVVCANNLTNCTANATYSTVMPTYTSNVICNVSVTQCVVGVNFQSAAPTMTSNRRCGNNVTDCGLTSKWASTPATVTSNAVCSPWSSCNGSTPYELSFPTATTDRVCTASPYSAAVGCVLGQSYATPGNATVPSICVLTADCNANLTWSTVLPTTTSNLVCANSLTNCNANQTFSTVMPTQTSNVVCSSNLTTCTVGVSYQSAAPTYTSDRVCGSNVTNCTLTDTWSSVLPTTTTDVVCDNAVTDCNANGTYSTTLPTYTSDVVCSSNLTTCVVGVNYQSVPPTVTSNRQCDFAVTDCLRANNTWSAILPTTTSNVVCNNSFPNCTLQFQYQSAEPTYTSSYACVSECPVGTYQNRSIPNVGGQSSYVCLTLSNCSRQYITVAATTDTDQQCGAQCASDEYAASTPEPGVLGLCTAVSLCQTLAAKYQSAAPTATSNRVCVGSCAVGTFVGPADPPFSSEGVCTPIQNCTGAEPYQFAAPTQDADRQCVSSCGPGTFVTKPDPPWTSSGVCVASQPCGSRTPFQSAAPTQSTNRVCVQHCGTDQFVAPPMPTNSSDGICTDIAVCVAPSRLQLAAPTPSTNRLCGPSCGSNAWVAPASPAGTSGGVCKAISTCPSGNFVLVRATATSDTSCSVCGSCASGEVVLANCTATSNTKCAVLASGGGASLGTGAIAGIVVGSIVVLTLAVYMSVRLGRRLGTKERREREEAQMTLLGLQEENEESRATVRRMLEAWMIPEAHIELHKQLAEGTYGEVWKGLWGAQTVAIKVLKRATGGDELDVDAAEDFRKECETLQAIKHPNLIVFFGAGTMEDGRSFMVTEFMAGGSLRGALRDPLKAMGWPARVRIAQQIAAGMQRLHSLSIVHRDLKSDNCLLDRNLNAKVADFGTSKMVGRKGLASPGVGAMSAAERSATLTMTKAVGTALWMAPEVFTGTTNYGPSVDVYSFGIILWELATRRTPWDHLCDDTTTYIQQFALLDEALTNRDRPPVLEAFEAEHATYVTVMNKCWAHDPSTRPRFDVVVALLEVVPAAASHTAALEPPPERGPAREASATAPQLGGFGQGGEDVGALYGMRGAGSTAETSLSATAGSGFPSVMNSAFNTYEADDDLGM